MWCGGGGASHLRADDSHLFPRFPQKCKNELCVHTLLLFIQPFILEEESTRSSRTTSPDFLPPDFLSIIPDVTAGKHR
ncbi:Hypothetical predicted protein [Podarcis lilfordi]|uniref:Uncharacterized protein n=1 Tax=Podarcis lilfordi TaxID=74358 RepID=A0AA35LAB1_9SAUR|nr:Hypothetical predicted protein [Podarcis lilfordi]